MSQEVIYTSAPQGLRPGSFGFCTVVATPGMASSLAERLESLSGYRHLFPPGDPQAELNPVVYSHLIVKVGGRRLHILSRIADAGLDYSQRSNKLAHHVALDPSELPVAPPAWVSAQPGFLETQWSGTARLLRQGRSAPTAKPPPQICERWREATGDPGWAGVLTQHALDGRRPAYLIVPRGFDPLPLLVESQLLLPERNRWEVTFSTYYTQLPAGVDCLWRCVVDGTPEAQSARSLRGDVVIDLTRTLGAPSAGPFVDAARSGVLPLELMPERTATSPHLPARSPNIQPAMQPLPPLPQPDDMDYQLGPPPVGPQRASRPVAQPSASPPSRTNHKRGRAWKIAAVIAAQVLLLAAVGGGGFWVGLNTPERQQVANQVTEKQAAEGQPSTERPPKEPGSDGAKTAAKEPGSDGAKSAAKEPGGDGAKSAAKEPGGDGTKTAAKEPGGDGTKSAAKEPGGDGASTEAGSATPRSATMPKSDSLKIVILPTEPVENPGRSIPDDDCHITWQLPDNYPPDLLELELLGTAYVRVSSTTPLPIHFSSTAPNGEGNKTLGKLTAENVELASIWRNGNRLKLRWTPSARDHETDLMKASKSLLLVAKSPSLSIFALERFDLLLGRQSFGNNLGFVISSTRPLIFSDGSPFVGGKMRIRNLRGTIPKFTRNLESAVETDVALPAGTKHDELSIEDEHLAYRVIVSQPIRGTPIFKAEGFLEALGDELHLRVSDEDRFHELAKLHRDWARIKQERDAAKKAGRPTGKLNTDEALMSKNVTGRQNALKAKGISPLTLAAVSDACNGAKVASMSFDLNWVFECKYGSVEINLAHVEPTYSRRE